MPTICKNSWQLDRNSITVYFGEMETVVTQQSPQNDRSRRSSKNNFGNDRFIGTKCHWQKIYPEISVSI